jgi:hypothetical protein
MGTGKKGRRTRRTGGITITSTSTRPKRATGGRLAALQPATAFVHMKIPTKFFSFLTFTFFSCFFSFLMRKTPVYVSKERF